MIPPAVSLEGDQVKAGAMRGFALSQLRILHNAISFQDLKQNVRRVSFADGSAVEVRSCWGLDSVKIFAPIAPARVEVEERVSSLTYIEPEEVKEVEEEVTLEGRWSPAIVLYYKDSHPAVERSFPGEVAIERDGLDLWDTLIPSWWAGWWASLLGAPQGEEWLQLYWQWHMGTFRREMTIAVTTLRTTVWYAPYYGKFFGRLGDKTIIQEGYFSGKNYIELGYELPRDRDNWQIWEHSSMAFGIDLIEYSDAPGDPYPRPAPKLLAKDDSWAGYTVIGRVWIG